MSETAGGRQTLLEKMRAGKPGFLLWGLTPPRANTPPERLGGIAERARGRIGSIGPDALVVYDLDDEQARAGRERPFPFSPTLDPYLYAREALEPLGLPTIIYRCARKYSADELGAWIKEADPERYLTVLVGAASQGMPGMSLTEAYALKASSGSSMSLGGVAIAERNERGRDEAERILAKAERGCDFFISQVSYSLEIALDLLSDLELACRRAARPYPPLALTLAACGSAKTLDFMDWLGIRVPRWLAADIASSSDPLGESVAYELRLAEAVLDFAARKGMPIGFNVESLSINKEEIEASVSLAQGVARLLGR
jgi:hypothetical protein